MTAPVTRRSFLTGMGTVGAGCLLTPTLFGSAEKARTGRRFDLHVRQQNQRQVCRRPVLLEP